MPPSDPSLPWVALVRAAQDLLVGQTCAGCGGVGASGGLCDGCRASLCPAPTRVVPLRPVRGFPDTVAAAAYDGVLRRVLLAHKEERRLALARPLGVLLAAAVVDAVGHATPLRKELPVRVVLVPVPSRAAATRQRGHDPVLRMSRRAATTLRAATTQTATPGRATSPPPRLARVLVHRRRVRDQSGLDLSERQRNLDGAFAVRAGADLRRRLGAPTTSLVVVDDVCSSGATLAAAASTLVSSGVDPARISAAVVAAPALHIRTA